MISEGYLQECPVQNGFGSTVDLTKEGLKWLRRATISDVCTMLVSANRELLALDQSRPEVTLSAPRFVVFTRINEIQPCLCQCLRSLEYSKVIIVKYLAAVGLTLSQTWMTRGLTVDDVLSEVNILNTQVYGVTGQICSLEGLNKFFFQP